MIKKTVIALIAFILLANSAIAKEDFIVTSQKTINLCACAAQRHNISIKNTGTTTSTYTIYSDTEWAQPFIQQFSLKPNQKMFLPITLDAPCRIPGEQNISIFISSNGGLTKVLKQAYSFQSCYSYSIIKGPLIDNKAQKLEITPYNEAYPICEEESKYVPLFFKNNNKTANAYKLDLEAEKWADIEVAEFSLEPQKTGAILVSLNPPANSEGNYSFILKSNTKIGNAEQKTALDVNVEKCHSLDLVLDKEDDKLCSGDKKTYKVLVKNNGKRKESLMMGVVGEEFADLSESFVSVNPGHEKEINLIVTPNISGKFDIGITAESPYINKSDILKLDIMPKNECYKADIDFNDFILNDYSTSYIPVKIKNNGIRPTAYAIAVDGLDWVSSDTKYLSLEPENQWNINIKIEPNQNLAEGDYNGNLKLIAEGTEHSKEFIVSLRRKSDLAVWFEDFYKYYRYYIYLFLLVLFIVIILLLKIPTKIRLRYRKYKIKKARLAALEKAREARWRK